MTNILELRSCSRAYVGEGVRTRAVDDVSLSISTGQFVAVMGPSGCGKSTLLNLAGLIMKPDDGEVLIEAQATSKLSGRQRARIRAETIGFVFQNFNLLNSKTVVDNVALPLILIGVSKKEARLKAEEMLERYGLHHRALHYPLALSGGQQQRVAILRALIKNPKLIIADEPTGNLDEKHGAVVLDHLRSFANAGAAVLMVTHDESNASKADLIFRLLNGKMLS